MTHEERLADLMTIDWRSRMMLLVATCTKERPGPTAAIRAMIAATVEMMGALGPADRSTLAHDLIAAGVTIAEAEQAAMHRETERLLALDEQDGAVVVLH